MEAAQQLGIKSLQTVLNANSKYAGTLQCPDPAEEHFRFLLRQAVDGATGPDARVNLGLLLHDIVATADSVGACVVNVALDHRELPKRSLLLPTLGALQGPALVVALPDVSLPPGDAVKLFAASRERASLSRLLSLGDAAMVLSAGHFALLDTQGKYLLGNAEASAAAGQPQAKAYALHENNLLQQFTDQFAGFDGLFGFGTESGAQFPGTLIRVPLLRHSCTNLAEMLPSLPALGRFLLFGTSVQSLALNTVHYRGATDVGTAVPVAAPVAVPVAMPMGDDGAAQAVMPQPAQPAGADPALSMELRLVSKVHLYVDTALELGRKRLAQLRTSEWQPHFALLRGTVYAPVDVVYSLSMTTQFPSAPAESDEWMVARAVGTPRWRDLALRKDVRPAQLVPRADVAVHVARNGRVLPVEQLAAGAVLAQLQPVLRLVDLPVVCAAPLFTAANNAFIEKTVSAAAATTALPLAVQQQWNELAVESLAVPWAKLVERVSYHPLFQTDRMAAYRFWPSEGTFSPDFGALCKPLLAQFYHDVSKLELFFSARGDRTNLAGGFVLAEQAAEPVRQYISRHVADCVQAPQRVVDHIQQLDADKGMFQRRSFHPLTPKKVGTHIAEDPRAWLKRLSHEPAERDALLLGMTAFLSGALPPATLRSLPLLPLRDGRVVAAAEAPRAIMATSLEQALLEGCQRTGPAPVFLSEHFAALERQAEDRAAGQALAALGVVPFDVQLLARQLEGASGGAVTQPRSAVQAEWLNRLWDYILDSADVPATCQALAKCCVLPVAGGQLLRMSERQGVLVNVPKLEPDLQAALAALGVHRLDEPEFSRCVRAVMPDGPPDCSSVADEVLRALVAVHQSRPWPAQLEPALADTLLEFFAQAAASAPARLSPTQVNALRAVPMYPVADVRAERPTAYCQAVPTAQVLDQARLSRWLQQDVQLLSALPEDVLQHEPSRTALYEQLGIPVMSDGAMLQELVLPVLPQLEESQRHSIVQTIQQNWRDLQRDHPGLVRALADIPCVLTLAGTMAAPSTLLALPGPLMHQVQYRARKRQGKKKQRRKRWG